MSKKSIAVIDSGIGGLSILKELKQNLPWYDYVYFADGANMPYGKKTEQELRDIAFDVVQKILDCFDVDLFVLACNTLTAGAIDFLRQTFPRKLFVGCEPNLTQPQREGKKNILVMSTVFTKNSKRINSRFANRATFVEFPLLAEMIENCAPDIDIQKYLLSVLNQREQNYDAVALGCTHYFLKRDLIEKTFCLPTYTSCLGVAKRVVQLVGKNNAEYLSSLPITCFCNSKPVDLNNIFCYL